MSSFNLFLVLILASAFSPICTAARLIHDEGAATAHPPVAQTAPSVEFDIIDNSTSPGNSVFEKKIGRFYGLLALMGGSQFVRDTLYKGLGVIPGKDYSKVTLIVESFNNAGIGRYPDAVASTVGSNIRFNTDYIQDFKGDVLREFMGIVFHESTHVWQYNGNGQAPVGLITGIADYVRLKAGYPAKCWVRPGCGDSWDEGYEVTAYFLDYCESLKEGFVAELNGLMAKSYTDDYFKGILGKSVTDLWQEYKVSYLFRAPTCKKP